MNHQHIDTNSIGFTTFETYNSDDLFNVIGVEAQGDHNVLDDAKMAVEAARRVRAVFKSAID